jgi:hypothetical protein
MKLINENEINKMFIQVIPSKIPEKNFIIHINKKSTDPIKKLGSSSA